MFGGRLLMTLLLLAAPTSTLCMDSSESSSSSVSSGEFDYIIELPDGGLLSTVLEIGPGDDTLPLVEHMKRAANSDDDFRFALQRPQCWRLFCWLWP